MNPNEARQPEETGYRLIFPFLCLFCTLFCFLSFDGYYFYDDTTYAEYAFLLKEGRSIPLANIFGNRWGLLFPLALSYMVFGVNDFSTVLLPFLCILGSLLVMYFYLPLHNPLWRFFTLVLFGLDFYTLFFSNKLYPDVFLTFSCLLASCLLFHRKNNLAVASTFVFCMCWAFLCKETLIYILPFTAWLLFTDLRLKRHLLFWRHSLLCFSIFALFYFSFYYYFTGDVFYRFTVIRQEHYSADYSYFDKPFSYLFARLTWQPPAMLISSGMMVAFLPALLVFDKKIRENLPAPALFYSGLAFSGLGMFWFCSTHPWVYNPIALFPRFILFLVPFFSIASGYVLSKIFISPKIALKTGILFLLTFFFALFLKEYKLSLIYLLLSLYLMLNYFLFIKKPFLRPVIPAFILSLILLIHPVYSMSKSSENGYQDEKELIRQNFQQIHQKTIIFADDKFVNGYRFYFRFRPDRRMSAKNYAAFNEKSLPEETEIFLLMNEHSIAYFESIDQDFNHPHNILTKTKPWEKVQQKGKVTLYRLGK